MSQLLHALDNNGISARLLNMDPGSYLFPHL